MYWTDNPMMAMLEEVAEGGDWVVSEETRTCVQRALLTSSGSK
jgi:hypothetical protein